MSSLHIKFTNLPGVAPAPSSILYSRGAHVREAASPAIFPERLSHIRSVTSPVEISGLDLVKKVKEKKLGLYSIISLSSSLDDLEIYNTPLSQEPDIDLDKMHCWVLSNIKCVSNSEILESVSKVLVEDNITIRSILRDIPYYSINVDGSFVSRLDVFEIEEGNNSVRKLIPRVSQLGIVHRGSYVGPLYGYSERRGVKFVHSKTIEYRPLVNLLMLKHMMRVLNVDDVCKFLMIPMIGFDGDFSFYQIMPYIDTTNTISNQELPKKMNKIAQLVANICNAACLANIMMQADCAPSNICFVKDSEGDIIDVRMFDCDVLDAGSEEDVWALFDFTSPSAYFSDAGFHILTGNGVCYDTRAALPPLVSRELIDITCAALPNLRRIASDYATPGNSKNLVPFMLQE